MNRTYEADFREYGGRKIPWPKNVTEPGLNGQWQAFVTDEKGKVKKYGSHINMAYAAAAADAGNAMHGINCAPNFSSPVVAKFVTSYIAAGLIKLNMLKLCPDCGAAIRLFKKRCNDCHLFVDYKYEMKKGEGPMAVYYTCFTYHFEGKSCTLYINSARTAAEAAKERDKCLRGLGMPEDATDDDGDTVFNFTSEEAYQTALAAETQVRLCLCGCAWVAARLTRLVQQAFHEAYEGWPLKAVKKRKMKKSAAKRKLQLEHAAAWVAEKYGGGRAAAAATG